MTIKQKKKKRLNRANFYRILGIVFLCVALVVFVNVGKEVFEMIELQKEQERVANELKLLEEENQALLSTKEKLEDPNYVTTYARGEYMFSKGDEKLFRLPANK